jgi:hypothetical protein
VTALPLMKTGGASVGLLNPAAKASSTSTDTLSLMNRLHDLVALQAFFPTFGPKA